MTKIVLELENCVSWNSGSPTCPYNNTKDTPGAGCASDYYCTAVHPPRKTSGYVEWSKDINPIPTWCPMRMDKELVLKLEQDKIAAEVMGAGI